MTANPIFRGAATALITPLTETGVDYDAFARLIDWQIEQGIDALVIAGTSGEGSTLSDEEHREVLKFAYEQINKRVPAIAGTGSNDTAYAVSLTKFASDLGYEGMLVVTPYYNKATQKGLVAMYNTIAEASAAPLIAYNVPSRTGVNIEPATYVELSKNPKITTIKEANSNISKIVETFQLVGDKMEILSGNDDQIVPLMSLGGSGVISVLSNLMPKETAELCHKALNGDIAGAAKMQLDYLPLINALFCETNPIPVKAAMAAMGFCKNIVRLPLTPMETDHEEKLLALMKEQNLI